MFSEISMSEMIQINGGNDAIDATIGIIEGAWSIPALVVGFTIGGPVAIAASVAVASFMMADAVGHIDDAITK